MSDSTNGVTRTFSQEDTSINPYRLCKLGTADNEVSANTSTSEPSIGISDASADATADNPVTVVMSGVAKCTIASASTKGGYITGTTAGKGLVTVTDAQEYVGILLETTTVSDQVGKVLVVPGTFAG